MHKQNLLIPQLMKTSQQHGDYVTKTIQIRNIPFFLKGLAKQTRLIIYKVLDGVGGMENVLSIKFGCLQIFYVFITLLSSLTACGSVVSSTDYTYNPAYSQYGSAYGSYGYTAGTGLLSKYIEEKK